MEYAGDKISLPGRKRKQSSFNPNSEFIETAIKNHIKKGGKIKKKDYSPSLYEKTERYQSDQALNLSALI